MALAKLFDLTEEEANHPNAGDWMVDCIKQIQVTHIALTTIRMRSAENQKIENYNPDLFKNKTNPLVTTPPALLK